MKKEKKIKLVILSKFDYQLTPLNDKAIEISLEDFKQIKKTKCFDAENNCVIDYDNTQDEENKRLADLRAKREPLLVAFDKYKTNILYGIEHEIEGEKERILDWYYRLLELNETAINEVPSEIQYYL